MSRQTKGDVTPVLTGLLTAKPNPKKRKVDVDVAYLALQFFLDLKEWSIQRFSRLTRLHVEEYPGDPGPIHPHHFRRWRSGEKMNIRFVMAATNILEIPISYFYLVGEQIGRGEDPTAFNDRDEWRLQVLLGGIKNMDVSMIGQIQRALNRRRAELSICKPDILEVIGQAMDRS